MSDELYVLYTDPALTHATLKFSLILGPDPGFSLKYHETPNVTAVTFLLIS